MRAEPAELELKLNHRFSNPDLLRRALVHSSLANEIRSGGGSLADNEQLEFLGDSILGFLVSEALVQRFPAASEGALSARKSHLVSSAHLYGVARRLDLGQYLELGRGEERSGGRDKKTLLSDALEALIAAIYLDAGIDTVRGFVIRHIMDAAVSGHEEAGTDVQPAVTNFKSALQELALARHMPRPKYTVILEKGPEHSKIFTVEVRVGKEWHGQAEGKTKKVAAQRAARGVYERMMSNPTAAAAASADEPDTEPGT